MMAFLIVRCFTLDKAAAGIAGLILSSYYHRVNLNNVYAVELLYQVLDLELVGLGETRKV